MYYSSLVMADEWADEFSTECESSGKSFGRGSYIPNEDSSSNTKNNNSGWEDDGWNEEESPSQNGYGTAGNQQSREGDGRSFERSGRYEGGGGRGGGGRGRGGREGRGGNRGGGGGFRDRDGDRDGYKRDGQRNGYGGERNRFEDSENDHRNSRGGFRGRGRGGGGRGGGGRDGENGFGNDRRSNRYDDGGADTDKDKQNKEKPREFYIPPDPTEDENEIFNSGISSGINFDKYDKIPVNVSEGAPSAISNFQESGLRQFVLDNVRKSGYVRPTPIQKNAIPIIMKKMDLMACAQTGSGKTAAYLLPIIHTLLEENRDVAVGKPHCFIISPTRELAIQIFNEARKFALGSYLKIQVVYGGTAVKHQGNNIARGSHLVVCTPGRLLDFVEKEMLSFEDVRFMVLDEADRMLDMGFMPSVEKVMNHPTMATVTKRQTLMFSATFPEDIQRLAGQFLNNYAFLAIGIVGGACSDVEQTFYKVSKFEKRNKLTQILEECIEGGGVMVFVETKRNADYLASLLSETKFPTTSIHGDRLQREREEALADFKNGKMSVLIATSVAARGLDIKQVAHVINYDLPKSIDEYVHRIGRTGRVGNCGRATSFYDPDQDGGLAPFLVKILEQANQHVPDFLKSMGGGGGGGDGGYRNNKFGGRDVRRSRNVEANDSAGYVSVNAEPSAQEPDEEW